VTLRRAKREGLLRLADQGRRDSHSEGDYMYGHPRLLYPARLTKDTIVEHKYRPGVPMLVVKGPVWGHLGEKYIVRTPEGEEEPVLRRNLKI